MTRENREAELRLLVKTAEGREELRLLYQKAIDIEVGEIQAAGMMGKIMIETILDFEFPPPDSEAS